MNSLTRKALIFALALAAVAAVGWFGRKAYRAATERRLIANAQRYFEQKDLRHASLCLRRALQIKPMSVQASRMMADMLEAARVPAALGWRIRAAQLKPAEMEYRFAWARTALKIHDLRSAADALSGVDDKGKATATYHKLGGALAWELRNAAEAEKQYTDALRMEPANASIALNLATIHLASTNSEVANAARLAMEQMAGSTNSEIRVTALHYLAADACTHKLFTKAIGYSSQLLKEPSATFEDSIVHLQLLQEAGSKESVPWLASLKHQAKASPASAFLLGKWMAAADDPATALAWLQSLPPTVQTNQPVPLIVTDCQIALKDWSALLALIHREDWGELTYYRLALESLAQRSLGQNMAAAAAWQKAVRLSERRLDSMCRLAQVAAAWHWMPERTEVLEKITTAYPKEKWAVDQLVAQLYAQGDTRAIQTLLTKVQASDPIDARLKNNLANVFLLRNAEVQKANRLAREAYDAAPNDPFFASTYAYSLLLQNRRDEALKVFAGVKTNYLRIPTVAAYYGVVEAQCGHGDIAKDPLARAEAAALLPEEKELVRQAKARL
jgi:tetratricopeptide (TPR) repeat protein